MSPLAPALLTGALLASAAPGLVGQDSIPARAAARLVVQLGHSDYLTSIAFAPSGRRMITGSGDGTAVVWDAETGAELRSLEAHAGPVWATTLSVGRALTGHEDGTARLWDVATGEELRRFETGSQVLSVASSPGGRRVVTGDWEGNTILWDAETGSELRRYESGSGPANAVLFMPDGRRIAIAAGRSVRLWDAESGTEVRRFEEHADIVLSLALSPHGRRMAMGDRAGTVVLRETATGEVSGRLQVGPAAVRAVSFSSDGRRLLTVGEAARIWDVATGTESGAASGHSAAVMTAAASPDGFAIGMGDGTVRLIDAGAGRELRRVEGLSDPVTSVASDGRSLVVGGRRGVRLWSVETGRQARAFADSLEVRGVAVGPDGEHFLAGGDRDWITSGDVPVHLWRTGTGELVERFEGHLDEVTSVALSPDGRRVLTGSRDNTARVWDTGSGREVEILGHSEVVTSVAISPDGRAAITGSGDGTARLWDLEDGSEVWRFTYPVSVESVAFSPEGDRVALGFWDLTASLVDVETGRQARRLMAVADPFRRLREVLNSVARRNPVAFSPGGGIVLTGGPGASALLWDAESGAILRRLRGHGAPVGSITVPPGGRWVLTGSSDGTAGLWDASSGAELVRLVSFTDGAWAVVAPDGRFDTNDLERIEGLHWVMPDEPFTPLPIEIFMRDYYEPRLLARILEGEAFPEIEGLGERNRVQPEVRVAGVEMAGDAAATVTVEVEGAERWFATGASDSALVESGAADLRLFRNGQLVGYVDGPIETGPGAPARFTFDGVRLPRTGADSVTFSAYAFNDDRVKSATAYYPIATPASLTPRPGRAYLITIGVDAYQSPEWNLRFAVDDARVLSEELGGRLAANPAFEGVVTIPLVSDQDPEASTVATKAAIRTVVDLLAGRDVSAETRSEIPGADQILPATPEDLVLISFSGHGYTGLDGIFYMFPSDIGADANAVHFDELLGRAISSDELTLWLRDVDAGDLTLIVDACHSAAAVEGTGFKPGPMGSRGLGQLAYDKGMRVLAASQAEDVALESDLLRQGLLTYALVRDGLEAEQADHEPADGRITMSEWLAYAVERVPTLYEEVQAGEVQTWGRDGPRSITVGGRAKDPLFQQPALFDFRRSERPLVLQDPSGGS